MRYAYALTSALLLGGAAVTVATQQPATAQTAQNEPGAISAVAPKAGAPMSFADMVAKLQPAVVNVSTAQRITQTAQANPFAGTPFGDLFGQQFGGGGEGQPVTREAQSLGSGFLISPDGYIVTNNHVIAAGAKGATVESITVTLADRKEYKARLIGRDQASDLALLKIDAPGSLPFVKFGDSTRSRVGDWVVAIGQPFGLGGTVTAGIISALHRTTGLGGSDRFIQTDAAINRGNSGGPMFNLNGDVIGINSQIFSESGGNIGIGFAIPAETAKPVIDTLMRGGTVARGYIGIALGGAVDRDIGAALNIPSNRGELIARVEPNGPAAKAGLRAGDVVLRVDGKDVTPDQTLSYLVASLRPGSEARFDVLRDGRAQSFGVKVLTRPSEEQLASIAGSNDFDPNDDGASGGAVPAPSVGPDSLGLSVQPLTSAIARAVGVDATTTGVVVAQVNPSSDAGQKLKRGDVISAINGTPVRSAAELTTAVARARAAGRPQVLLQITRQRQTAFVPVRIAG